MGDLWVNDELSDEPLIKPELLNKFQEEARKQFDDRLNKFWKDKNGEATE